MAQWVSLPATKTEDLNSVPRNQMVKKENQLPKLASNFHTCNTPINKYKANKENFHPYPLCLQINFFQSKTIYLGGWRDGSAATSTSCSFRSPEFESQQPYGASQPPIWGSDALFWHKLYKQIEHSHNI